MKKKKKKFDFYFRILPTNKNIDEQKKRGKSWFFYSSNSPNLNFHNLNIKDELG